MFLRNLKIVLFFNQTNKIERQKRRLVKHEIRDILIYHRIPHRLQPLSLFLYGL